MSRAPVEINGDPYRLDLPPVWIPAAKRRGLRFILSSDAHSTGGMENVKFAVAMARRGGLTRDDVLNSLDAEGFSRAVRPSEACPRK
jgi:DNA polymerase (family 10)